MEIPKIIHYCWFGGNPLPESAIKCIESWKKFCPGYEIKEWNETNYDVNKILYTKQAYEAKKWAFVSDYARFDILYQYGGLYFDTDVELIKPLDDILKKGAFMGCEMDGTDGNGCYDDGTECKAVNINYKREITINPGLGLAAKRNNAIYKEILDNYKECSFVNADGTYNTTTVVRYVSDILQKHGLKNICAIQHIGDINIYPSQYFCPINYLTGEINIGKYTYTIHHYDQSWIDDEGKKLYCLGVKLRKTFGLTLGKKILTALSLPYRVKKFLKKEGLKNTFIYIKRKIIK